MGVWARMSEQLTDQVLVKKVQNGDKQAFNLLVIRYQNKIWSLVARYVPEKDIQDVAQETFIRAYRSLENFRGDSAFYTWLYRIAVNTAKNYLTAQGRRPPSSDIDANDAEYHDLGSNMKEVADPEGYALSKQLKEVIFDAIKNLPNDLRVAISLRELEGLSYEEIAKVVDSPVGTVRSRIFRAREALDKKIRPLIKG